MKFISSARACLLISTTLLITACGQNSDKGTSETKTETKTSTSTSTDTSTSTNTSTATDTSATSTTTSTATDTSATSTTTSTDTASNVPAKDDKTLAAKPATPDGSKVNINLNELPDNVPICTVGGEQITIGDYKRMLRIQQIQANQAIVADPNAKARLLKEAMVRSISLTDEEKKKLLETAKQQRGMDEKAFQEFLKQSHSTEQQFNEDIILTGLAFKTSNAVIESTLLPELVNRVLLAQAAKSEGGEKESMNKLLAFKHSKMWDELKKQTGLDDEALKKEIVTAELAKEEIAKIASKAKISDAELKKLYEANKEQLKHGERIRISTIIIMCPVKDVGPIQSVKTQIAKANPKLTDKEAETAANNFIEQAKQKVMLVLGQAKAGADFAKLANENSDDPLTKQKKNGGDMGFVEKKDLIPGLADVIWKLKPGQVLQQPVQTELGFNLYKVTGKDSPGTYKYQDVKGKLEELAKSANGQQLLLKWLDDRKKTVKVEFTPKFLSLANGGKAPAKPQ